jgi:plasmid maintenance system antidote protein VapI
MATIGEIIKNKMESKSISRYDIQKSTGYDFRRVNMAIKGNPNTTIETYINICKVVGIKIKVSNQLINL